MLQRTPKLEAKRLRKERNRRYYRSQCDGAEVYPVRITPERHRKLTVWLRLGGHTDEISRANGAEIVARLIDALDV